MFRTTLLTALLLAAVPASYAAGAAKPAAVQKIENRLIERLSADGSVQLVRKNGAELQQSDAGILEQLRTRMPDTSFWALQPAHGLALRSGGQEALVPLPAGSYYTSDATRLSADGRVLAFGAGAGGGMDAWRWQAGGESERLVPQAWRSGVADMSDDGNTIVGWLLADEKALPQSFIWTASEGFSMLPDGMSLPQAISADGSRVLGNRYRGTMKQLIQRAAYTRFEQQTPFENLENAGSWEVVGISADSRQLAGFIEVMGGETPLRQSFLWDEDTGFAEEDPPLLLRGENPDFEPFRLSILAKNKMGPEERFSFMQNDAVLWKKGQGLEVVQADTNATGMSRDGSALFVSGGGWPTQLWQINAAGKTNLGQLLKVEDHYLGLLAVSFDGSRVWLLSNNLEEGSSNVMLLADGVRQPLSQVHAASSPQGFSADGRTIAGISADEKVAVGYPATVWKEKNKKNVIYRCPGDIKSSSKMILSADGKVLAAGQSTSKKSLVCLYRLEP
ncbi:MAG: hypothetical protein ACRCU9_00600 [Iodobacter sp.]